MDVTLIAKEIVAQVRAEMADALRELAEAKAAITELQARELQPGPPGKDGIDGKDGEPGKDGRDGKDGVDGVKGADGMSITGAFLQQDGALVLVQSDGQTKSIGKVTGTDGKDGESLRIVSRTYQHDTHEIIEQYVSDGEVKELRYPAGGLHPRGFWKDGAEAKAGDVYTHNGCAWVAKTATKAEPANLAKDWQLLVRKGADGRDAKPVKSAETVRVGK